MARPPRIPVRLPHGQKITYFVTICVAGRRPVLDNLATFHAVQAFCNENSSWRTIAAVVMPDHFHALVRPMDRYRCITQFSAGLKRSVPKRTEANWQWQEGVFDRLLRKNEFTEAKWHYMRENPVRAGLVRRWQDWPYLIAHKRL